MLANIKDMKILKEGYSFKTTLIKGLVSVVIFGIPVMLEVLPEQYLNLTVGGVLVALLNFVKYNFRS